MIQGQIPSNTLVFYDKANLNLLKNRDLPRIQERNNSRKDIDYFFYKIRIYPYLSFMISLISPRTLS